MYLLWFLDILYIPHNHVSAVVPDRPGYQHVRLGAVECGALVVSQGCRKLLHDLTFFPAKSV